MRRAGETACSVVETSNKKRNVTEYRVLKIRGVPSKVKQSSSQNSGKQRKKKTTHPRGDQVTQKTTEKMKQKEKSEVAVQTGNKKEQNIGCFLSSQQFIQKNAYIQ